MKGIRLHSAQVDTSLLLQISILYPTLLSAVGEIVSNAFDADAQKLNLMVDLDDRSLTVSDDGIGLTPLQLVQSYLRLGPSNESRKNRYTRSGRKKIGKKGIGFLACSNFCNTVVVRSISQQEASITKKIRIGEKGIRLDNILGVPIPDQILENALNSLRVQESQGNTSIRPEIIHRNGSIWVRVPIPGQYILSLTLDCRKFESICVIDTEFLRDAGGGHDLDSWSKYIKIQFEETARDKPNWKKHGTVVRLEGLKSFVIQDLLYKPGRGFHRNISAKDGIQRLMWHISQVIPVQYELPQVLEEKCGKGILIRNDIQFIPKVTYRIGGDPSVVIKRKVWFCNGPDLDDIQFKLVESVDIRNDVLRVTGYVLGTSEKIYPKEYRGLTIRVRNVAIGDPTFLGLEKRLPAKDKWVLKQITGEIQILEGIDALDGLAPGRDGFNTEIEGYKRLVSELVGEGESVTGILGSVIASLKTRRRITARVESLVKNAHLYRQALVDISAAINNGGTENSWGLDIRECFANGTGRDGILVSCRNWPNEIPTTIDNFSVKMDDATNGSFLIDFSKNVVRINSNADTWKRNIFVLGIQLQVSRKRGNEDDLLCEIDWREREVYVNWGHPLRTRMGDSNFLRSAIGWEIARLAYPDDSEKMMKLGLELLSYKNS